jgi:uncharacterized protein YjeT (DUF2065 family)
MDVRRVFLAAVAAFATVLILEVFLHFVVLADIYRATTGLWRTPHDIERLMPLVSVGIGIGMLAFTIIYAQGYERDKAGPAQGLRYGLYMGVFFSAIYCTFMYVAVPVTLELMWYWFFGGLAKFGAAGAVVGWLFSREMAPADEPVRISRAPARPAAARRSAKKKRR